MPNESENVFVELQKELSSEIREIGHTDGRTPKEEAMITMTAMFCNIDRRIQAIEKGQQNEKS